MTNEQILEIVNKYAIEEIEKFGQPTMYYYNLVIEKAETLAKEVGADVTLSKIGVMLMDIKLGECIVNKIQPLHVEKSFEFAKEILDECNASEEVKNILLSCVKEHHGAPKNKYSSKEAEVCANADCYRFLLPAGVYGCMLTTAAWGFEQNKSVDFVLSKVEEKFKTLSLEKAKQELTPYYKTLKEILIQSKI